MNNSSNIARRHFLQNSFGLAIGFAWAPALLAQAPAALPGSLNANPKLDSWLHIQPDGKVVVLAGKVEFGQGITTALIQIVADELEINMSRIVMIPTTTGRSPNEGVTSGSQSIEYGGLALRYAAADARELLLERASSKLGTPVSDLKIQDGEIIGRWLIVSSFRDRCPLKCRLKSATQPLANRLSALIFLQKFLEVLHTSKI